ncbi:MAG: hypothetical protein Q3976_09840 [Corynebacterium sp.]|nr:hypothetical protein [Corynebacterium sp.]
MENDKSQKLYVVLMVLALGASVVMLVTDNSAALKIALIAALWSAALGFFLVSRYRAQVQEVRDSLDTERDLHQQAQQDFAAQQAATLKERDAQHEETLAAINAQLRQLQEQLEPFVGANWETPTLLRAEAVRLRELSNESATNTDDAVRADSSATTGVPSEPATMPTAKPAQKSDDPETASFSAVKPEVTRTTSAPSSKAAHRASTASAAPSDARSSKPANPKDSREEQLQPESAEQPQRQPLRTQAEPQSVPAANQTTATDKPRVTAPPSMTANVKPGSKEADFWQAWQEQQRQRPSHSTPQESIPRIEAEPPAVGRRRAPATVNPAASPAATDTGDKPGQHEKPVTQYPDPAAENTPTDSAAEQSAKSRTLRANRGRRRRDERGTAVSVADLISRNEQP